MDVHDSLHKASKYWETFQWGLVVDHLWINMRFHCIESIKVIVEVKLTQWSISGMVKRFRPLCFFRPLAPQNRATTDLSHDVEMKNRWHCAEPWHHEIAWQPWHHEIAWHRCWIVVSLLLSLDAARFLPNSQKICKIFCFRTKYIFNEWIFASGRWSPTTVWWRPTSARWVFSTLVSSAVCQRYVSPSELQMHGANLVRLEAAASKTCGAFQHLVKSLDVFLCCCD